MESIGRPIAPSSILNCHPSEKVNVLLLKKSLPRRKLSHNWKKICVKAGEGGRE